MVKIDNNLELWKKMGKRIREERKRLGYSLETLADKIYKSRQTLSHWEKGEGDGPTVFDLLHMCEVFRCDFGYLVGEYDCRTREATDICKQTGLSEDAVFSLMELNAELDGISTELKDAVFSFLDILLDWFSLPQLAECFHLYISEEDDGKKIYIIDETGKYIEILSQNGEQNGEFLLLQNMISKFLIFAQSEHSSPFSRRVFRENLKRSSEEERAEPDTESENMIRSEK